MKTIRSAAVIGSGVMGAAIAAHLANSGIPCLLLDIVPASLAPDEEAAGLTLSHPKVRNRLAAQAVDSLKKARQQPALYDPAFAERIRPGNLEDDLHLLGDADWIIEVVVERLDIKQKVMRSIESVWKPGTIVSSNTSGISIREMTAANGEAFKRHFLGTHFFNPPRYMKLLEIVPGPYTDPDIVNGMAEFCERRLGKGVVIAKDTPNFIANRIGVHNFLVTLREMADMGFTVEEVDAVTGPLMGRPNSATFRTLDYVGIDVLALASNTVEQNVRDEAEAALFQVPAIVGELVKRGWIGEKKGQGFYKRIKGASGSEIQALNTQTFEYAKSVKVVAESLEAAGRGKGPAAKLRALLACSDRYSDFAWRVLKHTFLYSAEKLGEIADSIHDIDRAMKWGYNWELGPFELWDAIGLVTSVARMEAEGLNVPSWVKAWIAEGHTSFYMEREGVKFQYRAGDRAGAYEEIEKRPEHISLQALKAEGRTVLANRDASLIELGDGVVCLEFHTKGNSIGPETIELIMQSVEETERNYAGLVLANEGKNFCAGANIAELLATAEAGDWAKLDGSIRQFQGAVRALRGLSKPLVAAPHHKTLGGGVEMCLSADAVIFSPETYYGLVETAIGVLPAGGGCKELAMRASRQFRDPKIDLQPAIGKAFDTIVMAKVSASGYDAGNLGFMRETDSVIANSDFRIYAAKQAVLRMAHAGYVSPLPEKIRVVGDGGKAVLQFAAYSLFSGGYMTEHDRLVAGKVAHVLAGGDVPAGSLVTEDYLYDLEREAFASLMGEPKTRQRIAHVLSTGKPLRN